MIMKTYGVTVPFTGSMYIEVEAERDRTRPWFTRAYEMARQLPASQDNELQALRTRLAALQQQVGEADKLAEAVQVADSNLPELNLSNYNDDDVRRLQNDILEASQIMVQALAAYRLARQPDQRQGEGV